MKKCNCVLCSFENPKPTATAIVIKDQKLLVAKRATDPFLGQWDFPGGYVNKNETIEESLVRELKEELNTGAALHYIGAFTGTASYQNFIYPVINFAYLAELSGTIKLNTEENSRLKWVPIKSLKTIAFDSNRKILQYLKQKLVFDLKEVNHLVSQLDPTAHVDEQSIYKTLLGGYVSRVTDRGKLVGMGWIFPRQTLLRKQAVVEDMIVDEKYRGKGLGEKILKDLLSWAKKEGVEVVELTTNPKRIAANRLYQKLGFRLHPTNHYLLKL